MLSYLFSITGFALVIIFSNFLLQYIEDQKNQLEQLIEER